MRAANAALDALEAVGTAFERPKAPKHVATRPELRERLSLQEIGRAREERYAPPSATLAHPGSAP